MDHPRIKLSFLIHPKAGGVVVEKEDKEGKLQVRWMELTWDEFKIGAKAYAEGKRLDEAFPSLNNEDLCFMLTGEISYDEARTQEAVG